MRKVIRILVCLILTGHLIFRPANCSCSGPQWASKPDVDYTLYFDVYHPIGTLDPTESSSTGSTFVFPLLYSYLVTQTANGELQPDLATDWEYNPASLTWRFYLRPDAKFHNGTKVTSRDVAFTLNNSIGKIRPEIYQQIRKIELTSEFSLNIVLKYDNPNFLIQIWNAEILPHLISVDFHSNNPIGSGPFRFVKKSDYQQVILEAFDEFYAGKPEIKRVIYRYVPDTEESWARLVEGKTDIAMQISPFNYMMMKFISNRYRITQSLSWFCSILLYNTADPLFKDIRVRRALSLAINREYIVNEIHGGYGEVATSPFGVRSPFGVEGANPQPYAPIKAKQLMEGAGWRVNYRDGVYYQNGKPFEFVLLYPYENPVDRSVAQAIKLFFFEIGIRAIIQPMLESELQARYHYNTDFQVALTKMKGAYNNTNILSELWMPDHRGCSLMGCFYEPEIVELLKAAVNPDTLSTKQALYRNIENLLLSYHPASFLFQLNDIDVISNRIRLPYQFVSDIFSIHHLYMGTIVHFNVK